MKDIKPSLKGPDGKLPSLDDLEALIGKKAVEHCFMEYIMLTIAKAQNWDRLQEGGNNGEQDLHDKNKDR